MKHQDKMSEIELSARSASKTRKIQSLFDETRSRLIDKIIFGTRPAQSDVFLDIGCGVGRYGQHLAKLGFNVIGIDISRELLRLNLKWSKEMNVSFPIILGDAEKMPFRQSFDYILSIGTLHHFPDFTNVAKEVSRVVKPGGKFFAMEPNSLNPYAYIGLNVINPISYRLGRPTKKYSRSERSVSIKELKRVFEEAGFNCSNFGSILLHFGRWRAREVFLTLGKYFLPRWHKGNFIVLVGKKA